MLPDLKTLSPSQPSGAGRLFGRAKEWLAAHIELLSTAAVFVGTLAFSFGPDQPRMMWFTNVGLSALAAGTGGLSFRFHRLAMCAVAVMCFGSPVMSGSFAALELVTVFVVFQVVWRSDIDHRIVIAVGFVSLTVNDLWLRRIADVPFSGPTLLYPIILTALGVGLGFQGRLLRRQHMELVMLQYADRERAVLSERQRIARDLHDVAAHHLSALVVQNRLALRIGTSDSLAEAADFSAQTAAEALDSLRKVVGVLSSDSPLEPQPTLAELTPIVKRLGAAGLVVHETWGCKETGLRRDVELAVVRITQEALTNVLRHRGPGQAWLELGVSNSELHLSIEDDGVALASSSSAISAGHAGQLSSGNGYGLINMTERATSTGGSIDFDRSPRGGWRVRAVFPDSGAVASGEVLAGALE